MGLPRPCVEALNVAMSDVTQILQAASAGDTHAAAELLPLVYDELRRLAAHRLAGERNNQTLQPTALVHEAWLKISGADDKNWNGRQHFFAAAAEAMRRILVDRARRRQAEDRQFEDEIAGAAHEGAGAGRPAK